MKLVSNTLGIDIPCLSFYLGFAKTKLCCGRHIAQVMKNSTIAKVNKKQNRVKEEASAIPNSLTEGHVFFFN